MGRDVCSSIHPYPYATLQCPMRARTQAGLDSFREQLVEERVQELRRCEENLKAAAAAGSGGAADGACLVLLCGVRLVRAAHGAKCLHDVYV